MGFVVQWWFYPSIITCILEIDSIHSTRLRGMKYLYGSMEVLREGEVRELVETRSRRFLLMRGKREGRRLTSKREGNRLVDTSHRSQIFGLVSKWDETETTLLSLSSPHLTQFSLNSSTNRQVACQIQEEEEVLVQLEAIVQVEEILHNYPIQTIPQSHQVSHILPLVLYSLLTPSWSRDWGLCFR